MKTKLVVLISAISALVLATAKDGAAEHRHYSRSSDAIFANSLSDGGLIRMKHSPVLGLNVPIAVQIDGVVAGAFAKGHVYQQYLTPGRHLVSASRPSRHSDTWHGTIDVRRGETYSFVVHCTPASVILSPVGQFE